jgi:hypothetical protein
MKTLMLVILFLLIGAFFIVSNKCIKLDSKENFNYLLTEYGKWLDQLAKNSKSVTGYLTKMEWLPEKGKAS